MTTTLGEDLPKQMARVRDELMPMYQSIGPAGGFALAMMRTELDRAAVALAEGDLPARNSTLREWPPAPMISMRCKSRNR